MPITPSSRLAVSHLSIVRDRDEYMVGDPQSGVFLAVPEVGAVALRALQAGDTVAGATTAASVFAGEDVNVLEYAETLRKNGLIAAGGPGRRSPSGRSAPEGLARRRPAGARGAAVLAPGLVCLRGALARCGCGVRLAPGAVAVVRGLLLLSEPRHLPRGPCCDDADARGGARAVPLSGRTVRPGWRRASTSVAGSSCRSSRPT